MIGLLVTTAFVSCKKKNEIPSLKETFSKTDKNPFGTYVAFDQLTQLFYYNDIKVKKTGFEKSLDNLEDKTSLQITISKNLYLTPKDLEKMLAFVDNGNSMFLSCENFDTAFLNSLNIAARKYYDYQATDLLNNIAYTSVQLDSRHYPDSTVYNYHYLPLNHSFLVNESDVVKILGDNEDGEPNFILVFYGKGRFYLHCEPRAFSNYFLLNKNNYKYLQGAFAFIPSVPEHIFWDDSYNKRDSHPGTGERSSLGVLLQYPPMAWAFWLSLSLLLLYILFGGKRRQRIIQPVVGNQNTSVAFTETVSRLYLQKKDNRNIADKMITYFLEHIRNQYFLNTSQVNEAFISTLSRKANVSKEATEQLFNTINTIQQSATTGDQQLLSLNHQIENFYKYKQ